MTFKKLKLSSIVLAALMVFGSCASSSNSSYKPKFKKPNPNKPLPCPQKDC
jgi:hypothetical protein